MKHILAITLLSTISLACAMEPELHEPSKRTREYVEQALKAFEVPLESIKIYGFHDGLSNTGWANSDKKVIAINENNEVMPELFKEWICYHEAGHIKDEYSKKVKTHSKFATGFFAAACTGAYALLNKTKPMKNYINSKPFKIFAHSAYGLLTAWSALLFHNHIALPWVKEQGEIRADKIAIEGLLKMNNQNPIIYYLLNCIVFAQYFGNIKTNGHPSPTQEYENTKKVLEKNGYEVKKYSPQDTPNDLRVEITKDGKRAYIQAANFYSKV